MAKATKKKPAGGVLTDWHVAALQKFCAKNGIEIPDEDNFDLLDFLRSVSLKYLSLLPVAFKIERNIGQLIEKEGKDSDQFGGSPACGAMVTTDMEECPYTGEALGSGDDEEETDEADDEEDGDADDESEEEDSDDESDEADEDVDDEDEEESDDEVDEDEEEEKPAKKKKAAKPEPKAKAKSKKVVEEEDEADDEDLEDEEDEEDEEEEKPAAKKSKAKPSKKVVDEEEDDEDLEDEDETDEADEADEDEEDEEPAPKKKAKGKLKAVVEEEDEADEDEDEESDDEEEDAAPKKKSGRKAKPGSAEKKDAREAKRKELESKLPLFKKNPAKLEALGYRELLMVNSMLGNARPMAIGDKDEQVKAATKALAKFKIAGGEDEAPVKKKPLKAAAEKVKKKLRR